MTTPTPELTLFAARALFDDVKAVIHNDLVYPSSNGIDPNLSEQPYSLTTPADLLATETALAIKHCISIVKFMRGWCGYNAVQNWTIPPENATYYATRTEAVMAALEYLMEKEEGDVY